MHFIVHVLSLFRMKHLADKVCNSMILDYFKFYLNFVQIFNIKLNNFTNGNQKSLRLKKIYS